MWECEPRELDAKAADAVDRIKGCFGSGSTIHTYWNNAKLEFGTDCPLGPGGKVPIACVSSCSDGGKKNVITINRAKLTGRHYDDAGQPIDATVWQWLNQVTNHEFRHVAHNVKYDCMPWTNPNFWLRELVPPPPLVPRGSEGEERFTAMRSAQEYETELGVSSPIALNYEPADDKQLPNCNLWGDPQ